MRDRTICRRDAGSTLERQHKAPLTDTPSDGRGRIVLSRSAYPTALEAARDRSGCSLSRRTGEGQGEGHFVCSTFPVRQLFLHEPQAVSMQSQAPLTLILIGVPKLFIGGEESPLQLSPQPTVNNFALRAHRAVNNFGPGARSPAVTPRWVTNSLIVSADELGESFAPARRLGSKRILRCRQPDVSAIRPSPSPSQRVRNRKPRQREL